MDNSSFKTITRVNCNSTSNNLVVTNVVSTPMDIQVEVIVKVILQIILLISRDLIFLEMMIVSHNVKFVTNMVILLSSF